MVSKQWWCTVEAQEDWSDMRSHRWLKHLFIIELWSQKWSSHTPARTTWWMYVSIYHTGLYYTTSGIAFMASNPFHPCHYLLFWEFFQLVIDSSQLGLCGSQMVDLLYQSRQTRCSILEDRAQEMGCFRKVWSTAFREFMCLCVRGSMCAQTISFSSEFCRLQSRYCLLSWVKWWRKARPFLRSHNLSSSWVFCFCSRNICLSALNSHINNSQAQNHACLYK